MEGIIRFKTNIALNLHRPTIKISFGITAVNEYKLPMSPKSKNANKIEYILDQMHEMFRDYPMTELQYETPFQCLIAVMLSAQTTDVQVNKVTATLFQKIKTPTDIISMGQEMFAQSIKSIGLRAGKAKNIFATSQQLITLSEKFAKEHTMKSSYKMIKHAGSV